MFRGMQVEVGWRQGWGKRLAKGSQDAFRESDIDVCGRVNKGIVYTVV